MEETGGATYVGWRWRLSFELGFVSARSHQESDALQNAGFFGKAKVDLRHDNTVDQVFS